MLPRSTLPAVATAIALIATLVTAPSLPGQTYRLVTNLKAKVKYAVHKDLGNSPDKFGSEDPHRRGFYLPERTADYIAGRWGNEPWALEILEFKTAQGPETGADLDGDGAVTEREKAAARRFQAKNWQEFVTKKDGRAEGRKFLVKGKKRKGKGDTPNFTWWEYQDTTRNPNLVLHTYAACFELDGREVVLRCIMPCDPGRRPKGKYARMAMGMLTSLEPMTADELAIESDDEKDKHALTPAQKERLAAAKQNIADHRDWDYFTTPHYIIIYSFDLKKTGAKREQYQTAKWLSDSMEAIRAKFEERFPPHDNMRDDYSILRICDSRTRFMEYTGAPRGVLGLYRFAENVKELVIFDQEGLDAKELMFARAVMFHEGWHQYSDTYFGKDHSLIGLHRWWDEGMAEFFGAYMPRNRKGTDYGYKVHEMRINSMKRQLDAENWVPLAQMFKLPQRRFGAPRYAQAFFLMDFLSRGPDKLGDKFQESWKGIIDRYATAFLETGDGDSANKAAFKGVTISELEEAWLKWVQAHCR